MCWFLCVFTAFYTVANAIGIGFATYEVIKFPIKIDLFPEIPALRPITIFLGSWASASFTFAIGLLITVTLLVYETLKKFHENSEKKFDSKFLLELRQKNQKMVELLEIFNDSIKYFLLLLTIFVIVSLCAPIMALILANDIDFFTKVIFFVWIFVFVFLYGMASAPICLINENRMNLIKILHWNLDLPMFSENFDIKVKIRLGINWTYQQLIKETLAPVFLRVEHHLCVWKILCL